MAGPSSHHRGVRAGVRPSLNAFLPRTLYQLLFTGTSISTRFWAKA